MKCFNKAIIVASVIFGVNILNQPAYALPVDYLSYIGGASIDEVKGAKKAPDGSIYIYGFGAPGFAPLSPASSGLDTTVQGAKDGFVVKISEQGSLVWGTLIGDSGSDNVVDIAFGLNGELYIAGEAAGSNFPTMPGGYDITNAGGADAFVARLDPANGALLNTSLIGGSSTDRALGVAVGPNGNVYVVGETLSTNIPMSGGYDNSFNGGHDGFLAVFNSTLSTSSFRTYLGGTGNDYAQSVVVDSNNYARIALSVQGGFPTTAGAFDTSFNNGTADGAVVVMNPAVNGVASLVSSTYIGGVDTDRLFDIALDSSGNSVVAGYRDYGSSLTFPTLPGGFISAGALGQDAGVIAKFSSSGALIFVSQIGVATGNTSLNSLSISGNGDISAGGFTNGSTFFTTADANNPTFGGGGAPAEGILVRLSSDGSSLLYSSFVGGIGNDSVASVEVDLFGNVLVAGNTISTNLPTTPGAVISAPPLLDNGFVMKLPALNPEFAPPCTAGTPVDFQLSANLSVGENIVEVTGAPNSTVALWAGEPIPGYSASIGNCSVAAPIQTSVYLGSVLIDSNGEGTIQVAVPNIPALLNAEVVIQATSHNPATSIVEGVSGAVCSVISVN